MTKPVKNTWYVSYRRRVPLAKQDHRPRVAEAFPTEAEAKSFARFKLGEVDNLTAGTLNPHLPKRVIGAAAIAKWLAE
jgi:hypothetical protein